MNDQHDQSFGDDKLSAIYQQSRTEEPPMKLDSAILAEGRKAVMKKAKWWRAAWIAPIATVSVAVLAVTIGMMNKSMLEKQEIFVEPAADTMPVKDKPEEKQENRLESSLASEPAGKPASKPAAKLEERRDSGKKMLLGNAPAKRQAPASAPSASGATAPTSEGMEQERVPATAPATMKQKAAPAMERRSREALMPAPQQFGAEMNEEMDQAEPQVADEVLVPEAWLKKIRQLKEAGKDEEAARELELFRKAYPDYELPAGLGIEQPR